MMHSSASPFNTNQEVNTLKFLKTIFIALTSLSLLSCAPEMPQNVELNINVTVTNISN